MRKLVQAAIRRLRQFQLVEDGVAAVEFALILPIMLLVYVGSVEASALISMDRRVQSVSGALGDLVSRADTTLARTELTDYFLAAGAIMNPYPNEDLRQVVTQVYVDDAGVARVVWSRQYEKGVHKQGVDYLAGKEFALPDTMIDVATGSYVIVAEGSYRYLPLFGIVFDQAVALRRDSYYLPRFGGSITLN